MRDFVFHNPTKIIFGHGREMEIGPVLATSGHRKVLFVHGRQSIRQSGLYDRIVKSLGQARVEFVPHGGVVSNPLLSHTRQGIETAKAEKVVAVLAVGGGSVVDEAKAIAVGALTETDVWEFFTGVKVAAALPVYTVLTLAATGSEMNGNAVLTNEATRQKYNISSPFVYPLVSILNPELTCTVPPDYTAYGAVDAIAHVIEAYFTSEIRLGLQNRLVESIITTIIETTDILIREPVSYEARAEFMWAATLALNGLTPAGTGRYEFPNHMIEHSLSALYDVAHGAGLAVVIPAWMRWYAAARPERFSRFAGRIFHRTTPEDGIIALEQWFAKIGAPIRLSQIGISSHDIPRLAENAHSLATLWGIGETYSPAVIARILALAQ